MNTTTSRASSLSPPVAALLRISMLCLLPSVATYATTWTVPTDAPTIQAGVDSAAAGDTVLVLPGTYFESVRFSHRDGLALIGSGAEWTRVEAPGGSGGGLWMESSDDVVVTGFTWVCPGPIVVGGYEVGVSLRANVILYTMPGGSCGTVRFECVRDSEIVSNSFLCVDGSSGNLLLLNIDPPGACSDPTPDVTISQNLFWEVSTPIAWGGGCVVVIEYNNLGAAGPGYPGDNISEDPLLCDAPGGDFRVAANSPCLPANNPFGLQLGALGEGCGPINARPTSSWGLVKATYR
jgi:hypothetical protein